MTAGVEPLPRGERVYSAHAGAAGFRHPNWCPDPGLNGGLPDTNGLHCHCAIGAWRRASQSKRTPRGAHRLAGGPRSLARSLSNGGRPTCRSPHLAVPSRFERAPGAVPVDLPYSTPGAAAKADAGARLATLCAGSHCAPEPDSNRWCGNLAESGCARCPHRCRCHAASNGCRRPGRFTLPWRMAGAIEAHALRHQPASNRRARPRAFTIHEIGTR